MLSEAGVEALLQPFPVLRTHCHSFSECSAPFQPLLDSGSGKNCVSGQLHLLWQGFQSPDHLDHPGNVLIPTSTDTSFCHQPQTEPLSLKLDSWARDLWFSTEASMFHQCGEWHVSKSSTTPQLQMPLQDFRVSGCLSAKPLRTDPVVVLVSPGVLHILQHVMSLLMLAWSCLIMSFGISFSKKWVFWTFSRPLSFCRLMKILSWDSTRYFY